MTINSKEEELGSVGELPKGCSQIVLTSLYLTHIGGLDILWSVNKLARTVTKWTRAPQHQHTRFQDGRIKTQSPGCSKETVPSFPRAIGQSINCLEQLHPNFTRFTWDSIGRHSDEEWLFSLDRVPVSNACCTSPICNLCPWLHTDCNTVI